jgi:hypothetical protein
MDTVRHETGLSRLPSLAAIFGLAIIDDMAIG